MRRVAFGLALLIAGGASGTLLHDRLAAAPPPPPDLAAAAPSAVPGRPHPAQILNLVVAAERYGDGEQVLLTVPADRWLVVTDVDGGDFKARTAMLSERAGGKIEQKLAVTERYSSSVGVAFRPGSSVVLANGNWGIANLTGYYVPAAE